MLVSTRGRYALRVLVDMAEHPSQRYLPLREIAGRQDISEKYLESIVKSLVKGGLLTGLRGKGGGYRLARAPEEITVRQVLLITEGSLSPVACLEEDASPCARMAGCRTREMWQGLDQAIRTYLDGVTVASLARSGQPENFRVL